MFSGSCGASLVSGFGVLNSVGDCGGLCLMVCVYNALHLWFCVAAPQVDLADLWWICIWYLRCFDGLWWPLVLSSLGTCGLVGVRDICGCGLCSGVGCGLGFLGAGWLGFWFLVPVLRHRLWALVAS